MVMAAGPRFARPQRAGRLRDWLHVADALSSPDRGEYGGQDAHADPRLRNVACALRLLPHGFQERTVARGPRTHRRTIRRGPARRTVWPLTTSRVTRCAIRFWR